MWKIMVQCDEDDDVAQNKVIDRDCCFEMVIA